MIRKLSICLFLLSLFFTLQATGQPEELELGNQAYEQQNYQQALEYYEQAAATDPESPVLYFNTGTSFYQLGEYEKAREAFQDAAFKTKDLGLEAAANFNLGNCAFAQGQKQAEINLEEGIQFFYQSINFYQRSLELNPKQEGAAHNIEVTRLIVKDLLDKLKQQQEQNQEQQEKLKEIIEKLAQLVEEEDKLAQYSATLAEEQQQGGTTSLLRNNAGKIKKEQQAIRGGTREVADDLQELIDEALQQAMGGQGQAQGQAQDQGQAALPQDNPLVQGASHVDRSMNFQQLAENKLTQLQLSEGATGQENARDELIKAIEALTDDQEQQQQQAQEDQEQQEQQEEEEQEQMEAAEEVLDEERENKEERELERQGSYSAPSKDW